ncbi:hypothetical protein BpHYR1_004233 [Brachionus plicatilis]|uniref:Uncharacterized protein n=1 Tax=Brachionus plicatilis TaxID=10195 RepID=A0A3M7QCK8_BRAPC|nr:hypothetical protein BpHYR1_004233 [Brachionus plicatilis]
MIIFKTLFLFVLSKISFEKKKYYIYTGRNIFQNHKGGTNIFNNMSDSTCWKIKAFLNSEGPEHVLQIVATDTSFVPPIN